ncbi:MAG: hypothetical protein QOD60_69 [Solirubrobacterales bacterium]|jgi:hypothetical protein|nr:hypothetical protein [Solirubrobacterales bacterium]
MTERLFERFRWIAILATVIAMTVAASALSATPRPAFYGGTGVTDAGSKAKVELQVTRSRRGKVRVKILKASDGCFGASTAGAVAKVRNGGFAASFGGGTSSAGFSDHFDGRFSSSRSATVNLHSVFWNYSTAGPPSSCEATSTVAIHALKHP